MDKRLYTRPRRWIWIALFIAITLIIFTAGYAYYLHETERIRRQKYEEIATIGSLEARYIQQWRNNRLSDVLALSTGPLWNRAVNEWLREPHNDALLKGLRDRLVVGRRQGEYADALLLDLEGNVILSASDQPESMDAIEKTAIQEAIASCSLVLSDMYRTSHGAIFIDSVAPILDPEGHPIAVGLYRSNAESDLLEFIQHWPTSSQTGETLLVRKDGNDVLFLNNLRHRANTALSLREPLMLHDLPSVQAVSGKKGLFQGKDYRGVEVLADLRPIPNFPWFMVTKVDTAEILGEANYRAAVVIIFSGLFIVLAVSFTAYGYRHRQAILYQELYQSEQERRKAEERYRIVADFTYDWVYWVDSEGKFLYVSPSCERITGYSAEEFISNPDLMNRIIHPDDRTATLDHYHYVRKVASHAEGAIDFRIIHRDGETRWIGHVCRPVYDQDGQPLGRRGSNRGITERKRAEELLQKAERETSLRNQILEVFLSVSDDKMFAEVLKIALEKTESEFGTFGYFNESGAFVVPALTRQIYWDRCQVPEKDVIFEHGTFRGIWAKAIDEKRTVYSNEGPFNTPEGHIAINNTMAAPVIYGGKVISAIHIANKPTGYNESDVRTLEAMVRSMAPVLNARLERDGQEAKRKKAEDQVLASLKEKEVLLREIHHRVRNNLQVLSSMIQLQTMDKTEKTKEEALSELSSRIYAMATVHDHLSRSPNLADIGIKNYFQSLVNPIISYWGPAGAKVSLKMDVEDISWHIDTAISVGLIVNELVINAFKHAFPDGKDGEIRISLSSIGDGEFELIVADNGVGLPEGVGPSTSKTLGLDLVGMFADQLHAEVELSRAEGTEFRMRFEEIKKVKRKGAA